MTLRRQELKSGCIATLETLGAESGGDGFGIGVVGIARGTENLTIDFSEKEEDEAKRAE